MSKNVWGHVVDKAFHGNRGIQVGKPAVSLVDDPANNIPANCPVGTFLVNTANSNDVYLCTAANTTVVKITA